MIFRVRIIRRLASTGKEAGQRVEAMLLAMLPPPDVIRHKAEEVLARKDYHIDENSPELQKSLMFRLLKWFLEGIQWFTSLLDGMPLVIQWIVIVALLVLLVSLIAHIGWSIAAMLRRPRTFQSAAVAPQDAVSPEQLEREAERAEAAGDHMTAIRLLFRASLLRIETSDQKPLRRGITNRELLRRYRSTQLLVPLSRFVEMIDAKWYGGESCDAADSSACREEHAAIRRYLERRVHALGT